jgi:hypothetical protein
MMLPGDSPEACACHGCTAVAMCTTRIYRAGSRSPGTHRTCIAHHRQLDGQALTAKRWRELLGRG